MGQARALYDYSRQTNEELSFSEDALLDIYDTSDPEWTLVGLKGEYGFAPANYIEIAGEEEDDEPPSPPPASTRPKLPATSPSPEPRIDDEPPVNPAAALAGIIQQKTGTSGNVPRQPQFTPEASDDEPPPPSLPRRPESQQLSPPQTQYTSPSPQSPEPPGIATSASRGRGQSVSVEDPTSPSGYHIYNIHEMISHMGKNKKMPTTLGINVARGTILIAPEKSRDGPQQEWTAERLTHYSIEGKHVFVELVRPSKSIDFHAGARDTANEIISALGELAGASRAAGLKEVFAAGTGKSGQKKGHMLYEFMAQGDDEVTVAEGDEVIVLDDSKSDEWWMIRRLKNGNEGVVPREYVEVTGVIEEQPDPAYAQARSTVEQNRLEEERLTREAMKASERERQKKRQSRGGNSESKSKPNTVNVRTWTDRTGSFKVDAEFLGLKDGKIHMHKVNGIKIAVAVNRMSITDLEYVERMTGQSLEDEKPLSEVKRRSTERRNGRASASPRPQNGAVFESSKPKYEWFDFFLQCGVNPQICERYAHAFERDQMGEENLPDVQPTLLRTLGLKEGDILRVMKHLDDKFGRQKTQGNEAADGASSGGLFTASNGVLRNNTSKSRPAPAVTNTDTVDPRAFEQDVIKKEQPSEPSPTSPPPRTSSHRPPKTSGFEDDAWDVKPSTQPPPPRQPSRPEQPPTQSPPPQAVAQPAPQKPTPTGAMAELSLLSPPLQPQPAPQQQPQNTQSVSGLGLQQSQHASAQQQPAGADRSFFDKIAAPQPPPQLPNQPQQISVARQRPAPPTQSQNQNSFLGAPPPNRSSSAPQNQQPSAFGPPPLQPQMTGYQSQPAPPGQSLSDLNQQRLQQQFPTQPMVPLQPQQTNVGYGNQQNSQFQGPIQNQPMQQPIPAQPTGIYPQQPQQYQQPPMQPPHIQGAPSQQHFGTGQQTGGPFADPPRAPFQPLQPQTTGYQPNYPQQPLQPQATGINNGLPAPLQPQPTGAGFGGFGPQPTGFGQQQPVPPMPPIPPMPQHQQTPTPLQPQKTGPAPPIKFGLNNTQNKIMPQPTGKANLSNASKYRVLFHH